MSDQYERIPWKEVPGGIRADTLSLVTMQLSCLCGYVPNEPNTPQLYTETYVVDGVVIGKVECIGCQRAYGIEVRVQERAGQNGTFRYRRTMPIMPDDE